ncbi:alpha/beta hydrolase [Marinovum sp.]|uniref:alpha/beta fold hydrolase n=1 Tax=Marinovum sp. TaxID=2024839 RepID=UPI002B26E777|nr:alpha/beta hydrolase [Marinovum sp.]
MVANLAFALLTVALLAGGVFLIDRRADLREAEAEAKYGPKGELIDVDGTTVHALVTGEGPDLVLIHGASGNLRDFTFDLVEPLARNYRVIAFDRPGLGWTDPLDGTADTPRHQARLLQQAADRLGVSTPLVLGHSFGGAVALGWALERPEETAGLVLLGAVSNPWPGGLDTLYHVNASRLGGALVVPLITAFAPLTRVHAALEAIFAPQRVPVGYARHIGAGLTLRRDSLRANARQIIDLRPQVVEMSAQYPRLGMPVEILHGEADTIVPLEVHSVPLSRQLPDANLVRMPGVGHMPHHADPEAVIAAVDRAAARAGLREGH